jgi:hypothetical protein
VTPIEDQLAPSTIVTILPVTTLVEIGSVIVNIPPELSAIIWSPETAV